jgi:AraC-like DNA-binding protein
MTLRETTTRNIAALRATPHAPNVCVNAVRGCVLVAANAGLDLGEVASLIGVDPETLADPDARVSAELTYRAWDRVAERLGDPHFGLHAAEAVQGALFDAYDFAVTSATTMRDGLENMMQHLRLQHDGAEIRLAVQGGEARVWVVFHSTSQVPRHFCEFAVAVWLLRARSLLDRPFAPTRVCFRHAAPADPAEHDRVLGARSVFAAAEDCVVFDAAYLAAPLRTANPALSKLMNGYLDERHGRVPERPRVEEQARAEIERALREGHPPSVASVAAVMSLSVRSLQRALGDAGTSFQELLDEARRVLALRWIEDRARSLKQISNDLGFGQSPAFTRAFRRWTGRSPSAYRGESARPGPRA